MIILRRLTRWWFLVTNHAMGESRLASCGQCSRCFGMAGTPKQDYRNPVIFQWNGSTLQLVYNVIRCPYWFPQKRKEITVFTCRTCNGSRRDQHSFRCYTGLVKFVVVSSGHFLNVLSPTAANIASRESAAGHGDWYVVVTHHNSIAAGRERSQLINDSRKYILCKTIEESILFLSSIQGSIDKQSELTTSWTKVRLSNLRSAAKITSITPRASKSRLRVNDG